jgi:hypothetical protein
MKWITPLILLGSTQAWAKTNLYKPIYSLSDYYNVILPMLLLLALSWLFVGWLLLTKKMTYHREMRFFYGVFKRRLNKKNDAPPQIEDNQDEMRAFPYKPLNKPTNGGFSLAEVMIVSGLLAGLSLVVMQIMKNQQSTLNYAESRSEELEVYNRIRTILLQREACENTLAGVALGSSISAIKQANGSDAFVVNNVYGNRALRLTGLTLLNQGVPAGGGTGNAIIRIVSERLKPEMRPPPPRDILLQVTTNGAGVVQQCYADTEGTILTSKEEMCIALDGVYNATLNQCDLAAYPAGDAVYRAVSTNFLSAALAELDAAIRGDFDSEFLRLSGGTLTGPLIVNSPLTVNNQITATDNISSSAGFCIGGNCRTTFANQTCSPGSVVTSLNSDGTLVCQALSCPANQFFAGLTSAGSPVCRPFPTNTCPTNQYVSEVRENGTVVCQQVPYHWAVNCGTGTVVQSVSSSGTPTCVPAAPRNVSCPSGQAVSGFNSSGTPICSALSHWNNNADNIFKSTGRVGIGTSSPQTTLHVAGEIKIGNTVSACNTSTEGSVRYNGSTKKMEYCDGSSWSELGGDGGDGGSSGSLAQQMGLDPSVWPDYIRCPRTPDGWDLLLTLTSNASAGLVVYSSPLSGGNTYFKRFNSDGTHSLASDLTTVCGTVNLSSLCGSGRCIFGAGVEPTAGAGQLKNEIVSATTLNSWVTVNCSPGYILTGCVCSYTSDATYYWPGFCRTNSATSCTGRGYYASDYSYLVEAICIAPEN